MLPTRHTLLYLLSTAALLATCGAVETADPTRTGYLGAPPSEQFNSYWYQGKAELNHYALTQARYGELRNGSAVVVFVTEDFLLNEQVKYEGRGNGKHTSVLKTNRIERFNTGIYDYSMMTSVFSPVDGRPALKVTTSVQDWCGQVFEQVNQRADGYHHEMHSYFEGEGDGYTKLGNPWLEDALWNQVRIDPSKLPTGKVRLLPGSTYLRLMHKPIAAVDAEAALVSGPDTTIYSVTYPSLQRTLHLKFSSAFPHTIFSWTETRPDGFGPQAKLLTTTAMLTHQRISAYWSENNNAADSLRPSLGLERMPPATKGAVHER